MPTLEITDDHRDRIETLRAELAAAHAGEYASVGTDDALRYLLDLADAADDPDRTADPAAFGSVEREPTASDDRRDHGGTPFDVDHARDRLESRNRKHGDPDDADEMDLYSIAAAFDVSGRSEMTKAELIDAILDAAERLAADPFTEVDIELDPDEEPDPEETAEPRSDNDAESDDSEPGTDAESDDSEPGTDAESDDEDGEPDADADADGSSQLDAMMSLLDTHDDKWREGDGDARYEVDLPDGDVETARTKDDVRALLFKNY